MGNESEQKKKKLQIRLLQKKIREAESLEELQRLEKEIPVLSRKEKQAALKRMDDGIYNSEGVLLGERHPED